MMCPVQEDKVNFRVVSQPVGPIKPRVGPAVPPQLGDNVDRAHNRQKDHGKLRVHNHEIPWRNQQDVRQYARAICVHDFQRNASSSHSSTPCALHQSFAHQVPLPQMRDQNDGSVCTNENEMKIKEVQCTLSRKFHVVRQIRCQAGSEHFPAAIRPEQ